ncbi:MAG: sialate O-acetylesterase [Muribaculaceae bacterium]|nr:sialate O-acetylesterase [Muribaculaceae bacterium]
MRNNIIRFGLLTAAISISSVSKAAIELPDIVSDNMVLQQQSNARLWGWATPGSVITVKPSWTGARAVKTRTADNGRWDVAVATPEASFTPYTLSIKGDGSDITLDNVLVGEVWFCSGQSNMEMPVKGYNMQPVDGSARAVAESRRYPGIRMANVPHAQSYTPQDRVGGKWETSEPANVWDFSAMAYYFARELTDQLNVPVGIIHSSYGGSKVEGWEPRELLETYPDCDIDKEAADPEFNHMHRINTKYNAMVHPLIGYTIKGFVWNQGESNVGQHDTYPERQRDMVTYWRDKWGQGELPFYFVEIPGWIYSDANGTEAALFRECQHRAAEITPNSALIYSPDLVYPDGMYCIHSPKKDQLGSRMAYLVAERTYGIEGLPTRFPTFKSMTVDGNKASLLFDNAPTGFYPFNDLKGFEVAGDDGVFHPANAWGNGNTLGIDISCPDVETIREVRYNFKNFAPATVFNAQGLPLVPFRTDKD